MTCARLYDEYLGILICFCMVDYDVEVRARGRDCGVGPFATPLISHFARRAFGTSGPKQPGNWLEAGCIQFSNLDWR